MRMYELWKIATPGSAPARLEDEGGPVLFPCIWEAEEYSRQETDFREAAYAIAEVRAGMA